MTQTAVSSSLQLDLAFARVGERTVLSRRLFRWPFVLTRTFRLDAIPAHMLTVILQSSSSAVHGEDRLLQHIRLEPDAAVHLTNQGATAIHRAHDGKTAQDHVDIEVGNRGFLEYLPEPRILFPDAALVQSTNINCAKGATAILSDAFITHDPAGQGRYFQSFETATTLRFGGAEPVLVERMRLDRGDGLRALPCRAFGSMMLVTGLPRAMLDRASLALSARLRHRSGLYAAASVLPADAGIGVKLAARDLHVLRDGLASAWFDFRRLLHGAEPAPRRK